MHVNSHDVVSKMLGEYKRLVDMHEKLNHFDVYIATQEYSDQNYGHRGWHYTHKVEGKEDKELLKGIIGLRIKSLKAELETLGVIF